MKQTFDGLDFSQKLRMIELAPHSEYVDFAISLYAKAGGFRSAEAIGESAIVPLAPYMNAQDVIDVISAAKSNGQVYYASKTPEILVTLFEATRRHLSTTRAAWMDFVEHMREIEKDPNKHYAYPELAKRLVAQGTENP